MKQVTIAAILMAFGLSACSPKLPDVAPMEAPAVILDTNEAPAPVIENRAAGSNPCASDGIGGTGCAID